MVQDMDMLLSNNILLKHRAKLGLQCILRRSFFAVSLRSRTSFPPESGENGLESTEVGKSGAEVGSTRSTDFYLFQT